jgi:hypothetical protein
MDGPQEIGHLCAKPGIPRNEKQGDLTRWQSDSASTH